MDNITTEKSAVITQVRKLLQWEEAKASLGYNQLTPKQRDHLRMLYNRDFKYYYRKCGLSREEALCADTITPFWTVFKTLLYKSGGWSVGSLNKSVGSLRKLLVHLNSNLENKLSKKTQMIAREIETFAALCDQPGNFMLVPARKMNRERKKLFQDRIDTTVAECFTGGKFAQYFDGQEELEQWIAEQNLGCLFKNGQFVHDNLDWFTNSEKQLTQMDPSELWSYVERAIDMIDIRNSILRESNLPVELSRLCA